ncbi:MAG TPA: alpha/beta hydrolase [Nocardioidaceae bacterium]|nr:alpha/beta hydrolase [Nocardioidaceae bacterium]
MLLAHDEAGTGDPVLLLHSGVADRRMWQPQWEPLAERFRAVRCDLRGWGDTPIPAERFSNGGDVIALLDHLDVERAAIVGSSFGGRVALEVAATYPDRVGRLVLLCPGFRGLEPTAAADAFDEREDALAEAGDIDGLVDHNVATWLGPEADTSARDLLREMQRHAFEVQLAADARPEQPELERVDVDPAQIGSPTVVVSGGRDMDHFQAIAAHLATTIPHARLIELDWAGHLPSMERPEETTGLIIDALIG